MTRSQVAGAQEIRDLRPPTATLDAALETLMRCAYGVPPADVSVAAAAFIATLEDELGEAFTDAARAASRRAFAL